MALYAPQALRMGYERLCAWSEVLDQINVFPVADGDTGRNLLTSLGPLRAPGSSDAQQLQEQLLFAARGNSGNIAVQFVAELLQAQLRPLSTAISSPTYRPVPTSTRCASLASTT